MKKKYYAIRRGRNTGVYETWAECEKQISGFPNARFKNFGTRSTAESFLFVIPPLLPSPPRPQARPSPQTPPHNITPLNPSNPSPHTSPYASVTSANSKTPISWMSKPTNPTITLFYDGGCRGTGRKGHGNALCGSGSYIVYHRPSLPTTIVSRYDYLPECNTNNQAEYKGIILQGDHLRSHGDCRDFRRGGRGGEDRRCDQGG